MDSFVGSRGSRADAVFLFAQTLPSTGGAVQLPSLPPSFSGGHPSGGGGGGGHKCMQWIPERYVLVEEAIVTEKDLV